MPTDEVVDDAWVEWARCGRAHGLRGEVRVFVHNPDSDVIDQVEEVRLVRPDGEERAAKLREFRASGKFYIARFDFCRSRTDAEALCHTTLHVPASLFPPLDDDEWYAYELEGLELVDRDSGKVIGQVETLTDFGAGDVLQVRIRGQRYYLPFAEPYVGEVDLEAGTVVVAPGEFGE